MDEWKENGRKLIPLAWLKTFILLHLFLTHVSVLFQANTKQFIEAVKTNNTEKVTKFSNRGLDPNFHDHDSGGKDWLTQWALEMC